MDANSYDDKSTNTFQLLSNMPTSISAIDTTAVYIQRVYFSNHRHAVPLEQGMLHFINPRYKFETDTSIKIWATPTY